jgi:hypothetical protein
MQQASSPTPEQINTARVIARFGLRLAIVVFCAAFAQTSFAYAMVVLLLLSITFCFIWGTLRREPVFGPSLTNWDEAAAYACLATLASKYAF